MIISFITENQYWSPGLQVLNTIASDYELKESLEEPNKRMYKYKNGLILNNFIYNNTEISDSDAVFCIFDARNRTQVNTRWRDTVIQIINSIKEKKVILIGIRVNETTDWSSLLEDFNINEYLENKMVSLLFFKIGNEYRLEIFDQLKVMFSTIDSLM